jgi:biotin transport system permease protein
MVTIAHEVRDAQRARGASASPAAYVLPIVLRALRHADRQAEALVARGLDD